MTLMGIVNVLSQVILTAYFGGMFMVAASFITMWQEDDEVGRLSLWEKFHFAFSLITEMLLWPVWFINSYFEDKQKEK